ncbi:hypothetical protein JJB27_03735 [Campylobacter fetus subsp. venerealis]|uniref:hypothetical protein n=1 Tax=Campylobacter fetus TaxID=196 RepID=UPI000818A6DA|nr:hypothetical protein [Campylobacter fetus]MBK3498188.1 hypothetical protein [Campylobacter fetus subsp. venerealis]MBK3502180.1 hypothetical protein [Campylobacter fetus subsp. venerealis]OCS16823.1 hypothetical protein CfvWBT01109_01950 [Campylobacter fetus subsp. venerealis]
MFNTNGSIVKKLDELIIAVRDLNNAILKLQMCETNEAYNQCNYRNNVYNFMDKMENKLDRIDEKILYGIKE